MVRADNRARQAYKENLLLCILEVKRCYSEKKNI